MRIILPKQLINFLPNNHAILPNYLVNYYLFTKLLQMVTKMRMKLPNQ